MNEVAVWTDDYDLLDEIENIKLQNVTYGRVKFDDASSAESVTAYVSLATSLLTFLATTLPIIAKRAKCKDKITKVYVRSTELSHESKEIIVKYKETISIEVIHIAKKTIDNNQ